MEESQRKSTLEGMSHEELLTKCKNLLIIAQKAKQVKDKYALENTNLKEELSHYDSQLTIDKKKIQTMEEVIENLTSKNLSATERITELEKQAEILENALVDARDKITSMVDNSIEIESLHRQLKRMEEENESLLISFNDLEDKFRQSQEMWTQVAGEKVSIIKLKEEFEKQNFDLKARICELEVQNKLLEEKCLQLHNSKSYVDESRISSSLGKIESKIDPEEKLCKIEALEKRKENVINEIKLIQEELKIKMGNMNSYLASLTEICDEGMCNERNQIIMKLCSDTKNSIKILTHEYEKLKSSFDDLIINYQAPFIRCQESSSGEPISKESIRRQNAKLKMYKFRITEISLKLKHLKKCKVDLLTTVKDYATYITGWQEEITRASTLFNEKFSLSEQSNDILTRENGELQEKILGLEASVDVLLKERDHLANTLENKSDEANRIYDENEASIKRHNKIVDQLKSEMSVRILDLNQQLDVERENVRELTIKLNFAYEGNNDSEKVLEATIEKMKLLEKDINAKEKQHQQEISQKAKEHSCLLDEMREITEALKNRGEVISRQDALIQTLQSKANDENRLTEELDRLKRNNKDLNDELIELKEKIGTSDINVSDVMSTSTTFSRADDSQRMRDIDENFEERYNRLKRLAMKLKQKVAQQSKQIELLESENATNKRESKEISYELGHVQVQVKYFESILAGNQEVFDEIKALKIEKQVKEKLICDLELKLQQVTQQLNKLQGGNRESIIIPDLELSPTDSSETLNNASASSQYIEREIMEMNNQIEALQNMNVKLCTNLEQLKEELQTRDLDYKLKCEEIQQLTAELESKKKNSKSKTVLDLEIEAYEKSLSELKIKLDSKIDEVKELQAKEESDRNSMSSLRQQIKLLEQNVEIERNNSKDLKRQIDISHSKLKESEYEKGVLKSEMAKILSENKAFQSRLDELKTLNILSIAEKEKQLCLATSENEKLMRQIIVMEDEINNLRSSKLDLETDLNSVRSDFASYKIKAQGLLKQTQNKESAIENELQDEIELLKSRENSLFEELKIIKSKYENTYKTLENVQTENSDIRKRCTDLMELLESTQKSHDEALKNNHQQNIDLQEKLKTQNIQIETINSCFKSQINDMEERHKNEIEELKEQLSKKYIGEQKTESHRDLNKTRTCNNNREAIEQQQLSLLLMEREDAEGSENTSTTNRHRRYSSGHYHKELMPLDELLNSSFDDTTLTSRSVSPTFEINQLRERINTQENRMKHLSCLLTEAEQDLARVNQLNDVLKEEVRRQQRSLDREKHVHNSEYLKNIVVKFMTLNSGDEKAHLVPVLNTILKLSPAETQKLQAVARGGSGDAFRSWGSYLPFSK